MKWFGCERILADIEEIKSILKSIRKRRNKWRMSNRSKNIATLRYLGITDEVAFDSIYNQLRYYDYVRGPEPDNHPKPIPGDIWIFGLVISDEECYLKFQDKPSGIVMWISIHKAIRPLSFPYK